MNATALTKALTYVDRQVIVDTTRREGGFKANVYADTKQLATQGIGRHTGVKFGDPDITLAQAEAWLTDDLAHAEMGARQLVTPNAWAWLAGVRAGVLIDLVFNMGAPTVATFRPMLQAIEAQDWAGAALHLGTNSKGYLTPYVTDVGLRAIDNIVRLATGIIPIEFRVKP